MRRQFPPWLILLTATAIVIGLGFIDWETGYELNFFVFYFFPVSLAAWFLGFTPAVFLTIFSALIWFGADILTGHSYSSHGFAVWNTIIRLISFLTIGWAVSKMKHALDYAQKPHSHSSGHFRKSRFLKLFCRSASNEKKSGIRRASGYLSIP